MKSRSLFFLVSVLVTGVLTLYGDTYNYQNYIVGERAAGMGGAVASIADGIDSCYYNPAGLTRNKSNTLSISANLYGFHRYDIDNAWFPEEDYSSETFQSIPTSMGSVVNMNTNISLAFSVFVPDKDSQSEISVFPSSRHSNTYSFDYQSLWLGPSAGVRVSPEWLFGASVFGVYNTYTYMKSVYWENESLLYTENIKTENMSVLSVLGLQYRPDALWNYGVMFQTPNLNLRGNGEMLYDYMVDNQEQTERGSGYADDVETTYRIPPRIILGFGQEKNGCYAWGIDVSHHFATTYNSVDGTMTDGQPVDIGEVHLQSVTDVNLGVEYILAHRYPVRAGFFTSYSAAPDVNAQDLDSVSRFDKKGFTASIGKQSEYFDISIGGEYVMGSGNAIGYQMVDGRISEVVVDSTSSQFYLFMNTAYHF